MNLKNGKVFTSKFVGNGPSSYERRLYRAAVSQRLTNTALGYPITADIFFLIFPSPLFLFLSLL